MLIYRLFIDSINFGFLLYVKLGMYILKFLPCLNEKIGIIYSDALQIFVIGPNIQILMV